MERHSEELLQLAHLLRVGADMAREAAPQGENEAKKVFALAGEAENIAAQLEALIKGDSV